MGITLFEFLFDNSTVNAYYDEDIENFNHHVAIHLENEDLGSWYLTVYGVAKSIILIPVYERPDDNEDDLNFHIFTTCILFDHLIIDLPLSK